MMLVFKLSVILKNTSNSTDEILLKDLTVANPWLVSLPLSGPPSSDQESDQSCIPSAISNSSFVNGKFSAFRNQKKIVSINFPSANAQNRTFSILQTRLDLFCFILQEDQYYSYFSLSSSSSPKLSPLTRLEYKVVL